MAFLKSNAAKVMAEPRAVGLKSKVPLTAACAPGRNHFKGISRCCESPEGPQRPSPETLSRKHRSCQSGEDRQPQRIRAMAGKKGILAHSRLFPGSWALTVGAESHAGASSEVRQSHE